MKAFSFCLYNPPKPLYYTGLLENIRMIKTYYPDWCVYVYIGNDVPESFVYTLIAVDVRVRYTNETGSINMIYRFLAIEEPDVELMMVRDADSRIHWKDRWAINEFVNSPKLAHTIRDQTMHTIPMLGGLWGLKKSANVPIGLCFNHYKTEQLIIGNAGKDQTFLNTYIWPRVKHTLLAHSSVNYTAGPEELVTFPFPWSNDNYCGRIEGPGYVEPVQPSQSRLFTHFINRSKNKLSLK